MSKSDVIRAIRQLADEIESLSDDTECTFEEHAELIDTCGEDGRIRQRPTGRRDYWIIVSGKPSEQGETK